LFFIAADLCVDDHSAESPHCLLTTISRDNYSGRSFGKIFLKICGNATKTFFREKLTFLILLLFKALHGQLFDALTFRKVDCTRTMEVSMCNAIVNHNAAPTANSVQMKAAGFAII
jgi:hypothetical protein